MNKKQLRIQMLEKRNNMREYSKNTFTNHIVQKLFETEFYQESNSICVYEAFRNEVSCDQIIKDAFKKNKNVFVPITNLDLHSIDFAQIFLSTKWKIGPYGIKEPIINNDTTFLKEAALILMPGLIFDTNKHRIGYGGGYYDKYLATHPFNTTCALCYDFQIIDQILPYEPHDILPNWIITNERIL